MRPFTSVFGRVSTIHPTRVAWVGLAVLAWLPPGAAAAQAPLPGPNVNVISGTGTAGDWTMQRQNEPPVACSSRNPLTCLAVAVDYRAVDIRFPPDAGRVIGDAWHGVYTTSRSSRCCTSGRGSTRGD